MDPGYFENINFDYNMFGGNSPPPHNQNQSQLEHYSDLSLNGMVVDGPDGSSSNDTTPASSSAMESETDTESTSSPQQEPEPPDPDFVPRNRDQSQIIETVTDGLIHRKNLLIESPPKMERKMTILKGILSFWQWKKHGMPNNLLDAKGVAQETCPDPSRIYIGTRNFLETKTFLEETKDDLGTTNLLWKVRMTILDHRDNLCINQFVTHGDGDINHSCRQLICQRSNQNFPTSSKKPRNEQEEYSCEHYRSSAEGALPYVRESLGPAGPQQEVHDIEDMMLHCQQTGRCPYYDGIHQIENADLVICPVEFLLSAYLRHEYRTELENAIVLIDDGYDLEYLCKIEASMDMSTEDLNTASSLLQAVVHNLDVQEDIGVAELESFLNKLSIWIRDNGNKNPDREEILLVINQLNINSLNIPLLLTQFFNYAQNFAHAISNTEAIALEKLRKFVTILPLLLASNDSFTVKITLLESPSNCNRMDTILQIICADPSIVLKLVEEPAISLIIGSNIIAPYSHFTSEFPNIDFEEPLKIHQDNFIVNERLLVAYTGKGLNGVKFTLNYNSRNSSEVKKELGLSLWKLLEIIPNGKIVAFHSQEYLTKLLDYWRNTKVASDGNTIMELISGSVTKVVNELEMKTDKDTQIMMKDFQEAAQTTRGAVLLALHRGNLYKNWDSKFETVPRAIIHVSLPFGPWKQDDVIIAKRHYLDRKYGGHECPENLEWYIKESFRTLSQSFCYVIDQKRRRKKEDCWGVVIVLHDRMRGERHEFKDKLPKWLPTPKYHRDFSGLIRNLQEKMRGWTDVREHD